MEALEDVEQFTTISLVSKLLPCLICERVVGSMCFALDQKLFKAELNAFDHTSVTN